MKRLAIIMAGVFVIGTAAMAQNRTGQCTTKLNGLTSQQTEQINQLVSQHQQVMDGLRTERRSTADFAAKDNVRSKMLSVKETYRKQMKEILTPDQWAQYETFYQAGYRGGQGKGNGQDYHRSSGKKNYGNGNRTAGKCMRAIL
ncbi:MAG: hypothetical protein RBS73_07610 [Prolixibacteraceae bacterium]|jgi:hypothetical protein|nr:hypothetical protein [Prolixibacteraceae bacterium]